MAVLCLIGGVALLAGGRAEAQSVVNRLSAPPPAPRAAPVREYNPTTPPAANAQTVVSSNQEAIAAALAILPGETNAQYTERMRVRYGAAVQEMERVSAEHAARMRALADPSHR